LNDTCRSRTAREHCLSMKVKLSLITFWKKMSGNGCDFPLMNSQSLYAGLFIKSSHALYVIARFSFP
jgi:hypothetical protein